MSQIHWIKIELAKHFLGLNLKEGADLDHNGKIEGPERTDQNDDGKVDLAEWKKFLNKNESSLTALGGFFKYYYNWGENLKPDNPIHDLLAIESEMATGEEIKEAYRIVGRILEYAQIFSPWDDYSAQETLKLVYTAMLFNGIKLTSGPENHARLFVEDIDAQTVDCLSSSLLALSVAHETGWPVYLVRTPGHAFVRWDDGAGNIFNMDHGKSYDDEYYINKYNITKKTIKKGIYLSKLNRKEIIALLYLNRGNKKAAKEDRAGALSDYNRATKLDRKLSEAIFNRGLVKFDLKKYKETFKDFNEIIENLGLEDAMAYTVRGAANMKLGKLKKARKDYHTALNIDSELKEARRNLLVMGLFPYPYHLSLQSRFKFIDDDLIDTRMALGATWSVMDISDNAHLGPRAEIGYGTLGKHHLLDLSAGFAFIYGNKKRSLTTEAGVGYNFLLAGEISQAPLKDGAFFQYGIHYHSSLSDSFGIGTSLVLQHEMKDPSQFALLPALEFTYFPW